VSTAALLAWHVPAAYDAAVDHAPLHALEHLAFLLTAVVLWVGAVGAVRAGAWPAALLGLFVASLPPTGLGVALTLARTPWYAPYADGADPVGAQQLAGVVMWGAGGVLAVATAVALVLVALRGAERTAPERVTVAPPPPTVRPATPLGTPHPDGMAGRS
jgi:cytochrome c oxidase assembly factor CtaG